MFLRIPFATTAVGSKHLAGSILPEGALSEAKGRIAAFLICDIAVRPTPERSERSLGIELEVGNFSARKRRAAKGVG